MKENDDNSRGCNEPLLIKQIPTENKFWTLLKRIGSTLAILLTAYILLSNLFPGSFTKMKVESKVISMNYRPFHMQYTPLISDTSDIKGIYYLSRISLNVVGTDLIFNDINIYVQFPNKEKYKGELVGVFDMLNTWNMDNINYYADIPKEELLFYQSVLETNKTHFYYLSFYLHDTNNILLNESGNYNLEYKLPESFEVEFILSKRRMFAINNRSSIKTKHFLSAKYENRILFDKSIFKEK